MLPGVGRLADISKIPLMYIGTLAIPIKEQ